MKKNILLCLAAFVLTACGGGDGPGEDPVISKDYINVAPNLQLLGDGQETTLTIHANCSWTITVSDSWLAVSPSSGSNDQEVKVSAGKNPTGKDRSATLTIQGGNAPSRSVMVTQVKAYEASSLSVNVSSLSFEAKGESKTFTISSNTSWTITKPDWCAISETSGTGNASITVTVAENPNQEQRTGQIVISGENVVDATIAMSQKAKEADDNQEPGKDDNLPPS